VTAPSSEIFVEMIVAADGARAVVRPEHAGRLCAGHFPDEPLVPGAHLAGLMAELGAALLAATGHPTAVLAEIVQCVFVARVHPDAGIHVEARRRGELEIEADIVAADRPAARAVLRFAERG
jgi:3-hydroxymyristoyl/3-hydroxydecanoyl-(acyl carrier protein) dehydratase